MAGIYIHIPFCKKVCSYCDFYKTAVISRIPDYLKAIEKELTIRTSYLEHEQIETIYVGGGTPSLLSPGQLEQLLKIVYDRYAVSENCEVTLEANPDNLTFELLRSVASDTPVNRLSIGTQSFNQRDLQFLNRRHTARQAINSIEDAHSAGFKNISLDLIYGLPGMNAETWQKNLETAFSLEVEHLSAYHLTIEPGTALARLNSRGELLLVPEEESAAQFYILHEMAVEHGFIHYEISNLAKEGYYSRHNANYWAGKKYLGAGPSAHSYDILSRQWNVADVNRYINGLAVGELIFDREALDLPTRFNEYLMVSLRTSQGINREHIRQEYGQAITEYLDKVIQPFLNSKHMVVAGPVIKMTLEGWLISDYILSRLVSDT